MEEQLEKLSQQQIDIVTEYVTGGNKYYAYRKFIPDAINAQIAWFFKQPKVKELVTAMNKEVRSQVVQKLEKVAIDKAWVQERLRLLVEFNINSFLILKDGRPHYDFSKATLDDWYCISEYTANRVIRGADEDVYPVDQIKLKTHDKMKAIELIGKTVGAFTDKVEHGGNVQVVFSDDYEAD